MISAYGEVLQSLINAGPDAQKNLYIVDIKPVDNGQAPRDEKFFEGLSVRLQDFTIPAMALKTVNLAYQDITVPKVVSGETFKKTLSLHFRSDVHYQVYHYLRDNLRVASTESASSKSFSGSADLDAAPVYYNISIYLFNDNGRIDNPLYTFKYCEATSLGSLGYSYTSPGPHTVDVNWIYQELEAPLKNPAEEPAAMQVSHS